jgi:tRNA(Ile2) C34 agmatinyltransferase TiaS
MPLIRCPSCRYSFEYAGDERPKKCQQCGGRLEDTTGAPKAAEDLENKPTQRLKTIPKLDD